jgi:hypothetical protein
MTPPCVPVFRCDAPFDHLKQVLAVPLELERVRGLPAMLASDLAPHALIEDELLFDSLGDEHRGAIAAMCEEHQVIEGMLHQSIECADAAEMDPGLGGCVLVTPPRPRPPSTASRWC